MGFFAIRKACRKNLFCAFTLSILIATSSQLVLAVGPNDATLEKLEKWLFFATFPDESDEARVKRLEERTFGDAAEGPVDQRLKKLDEILTDRQKEKEAKDQPASSKPAPAPAASSSGTGTAGSAPAQNKQSEAEAAKERQRIAVQAAREQEMSDLLEEGAKLWRSRHGEEAVERFLQVLRLDPHNATAHFSIGVVQESQGKLKEAREHYQQASQAEPDNKDYADAVIAVGNKIKQADNDPNKVLNEQAAAAFKRGEYISAINLYKELETKNPKQATVKYSLGTTYLMMKDHFNAMEYFKLAVQLEPNNPKYMKAYNELSAEMAKHQQEQQGVEQQYGGMTSEGALSPPTGNMGQMPLAAIPPAQGGTGKEKKEKGGKKAPPAVAATTIAKQGKPTQQQMPQGQYQAPQQQMSQMQYQAPPQQMQQGQYQAPAQMTSQYQAPPQQFSQYPQQQQRMPNPQFQQQQYQGQYQGGPGMQQNPYNQAGYQNAMSQSSGGTYIPPDPQQFSYHAPKQSQQQQMPMQQQQMPMQQQQMPMQQQQMPMQQQQMPMQQNGYSGQQYQSPNQYGNQGMQSSGGSDYTPSPQAAPQGAFDPRLAQRLNNPNPQGPASSSSADPMGNYGLSGKGSQEGVVVNNVRSGSRAARAGLRKGDVIRTVDGNEVTQTTQLNQVLSQYDGSQTLPLLIFRDGILTPIQF